VVARSFAGKTLLQRHRLINDALKAEMSQIHALSVKKAAPPPE
jgi:stress-induced morphogen